jgi:HYR domain
MSRTRLYWSVLLALTTVFTLVLGTLPAGADNLQNDATTTTGITTITAGDSTTITYTLIANSSPNLPGGGGDPSGCDATSSKPVTVTITKPAAVSGPATLSFTGCGNSNTKTATFSSSTPGKYDITHSISGGVSGSLFNNQANFALTVNPVPPPPNTPPTLTLPSDQTAEATGPGGAAVDYTASANDAEDGSLTPACSPASGSTFPLGVTQVNCTATDSGGLSTSGMFNVTVVDTTAPALDLPADITKEASGPNGAAVSFSASASDVVDGAVNVNCTPASGSTFALGTTTVSCSATDAHGNTASGSFDVTVQDTTPPTLHLPANITEEATGPSGAAVTFSVSASDVVDGSVGVTCTHASGSTFALDTTTTVSCTASDAHGNTASGSFDITVVDTTAPALNLPANITTQATGNSQAVVTYSASATDLVDGSVPVSCSAASGSSFPAGTTTVTCSATDAHGNTKNGSFTVSVVYGWAGFFQPVDNTDATGKYILNVAKAGSTIPVKFSLAGDQGLNIFATGYPKVSATFSCSADPSTDPIEEYSTATVSGLKYDPTANQYIYNWKTDKGWAGGCRSLLVKLADGSTHRADFNFTR